MNTKRRHGDLKGANSPFRIERVAYWAWQCLRHPSTIGFLLRHTTTWLAADGSDVRDLWIYGGAQHGLPLYTGVDIGPATVYGDSTTLRHLAQVLVERADHYDRIAAVYERGEVPTWEDLAPASTFAESGDPQ